MKKLFVVLLLAIISGFGFAQMGSTECIAPAGPGGGWDFTCRIPAAKVMTDLGIVSNMKVTNMSGGGGAIAYGHVVSERNTDENLIVAASAATATRLAQNVYAGLSEDDVRWIGAVGADYGVIAVGKNSPYQNLNELLADLTAGKKLSFAGGGSFGGWDHLKALMLAQAAGIEDLKSVHYVDFDGGGAAMIEILAGRADVFTGDTSEVLAQYDAGEVRVLAILAPVRIERLPDVPTATELGYDVIGGNWRAFYAPGGISDAAYDKWVSAVDKVAHSDEWEVLRDDNGLARFEKFGAEFDTFVREQIALIRSISEELGLVQ